MVKCADIKEAKKTNWLQVMYYARERNKQFGRLIFVSKDDLCIQEYVQPLDDYWLMEIAFELSTLRRWWEREVLPPTEARAFGGKENIVEKPKKSPFYSHPKECSYCAWFDWCVNYEAKK